MVDIWFGEFSVGSIERSSGVFAGSNKQWKHKHASKRNEAFGKVSGRDGQVTDTVSVLADRDEADTYSAGPERKP